MWHSWTPQGISVGGHGAGIPSFKASSYAASTSAGDSTHQLIHVLPAWLSHGCCGIGPPRAPWQFWQRKISVLPETTAPKVGGSPKSQCFFQPSFSNHAKLSSKLVTFSIGVTACTFISLPHLCGTFILFERLRLTICLSLDRSHAYCCSPFVLPAVLEHSPNPNEPQSLRSALTITRSR